MKSIKDLLYNQIKENCRTNLEKKQFLDRVSFDYITYYEVEDENEVEFEIALYEWINNIATDGDIETTIDSLMESGIQNTVLSHRKQIRKRLKFDDLKLWMVVFSESLRTRFIVWNKKNRKVYLKDVTKYAEWQRSFDYADHEIDDNFFHISVLI